MIMNGKSLLRIASTLRMAMIFINITSVDRSRSRTHESWARTWRARDQSVMSTRLIGGQARTHSTTYFMPTRSLILRSVIAKEWTTSWTCSGRTWKTRRIASTALCIWWRSKSGACASTTRWRSWRSCWSSWSKSCKQLGRTYSSTSSTKYLRMMKTRWASFRYSVHFCKQFLSIKLQKILPCTFSMSSFLMETR